MKMREPFLNKILARSFSYRPNDSEAEPEPSEDEASETTYPHQKICEIQFGGPYETLSELFLFNKSNSGK